MTYAWPNALEEHQKQVGALESGRLYLPKLKTEGLRTQP